jgi:hypothetical protein
MITARRKIKYTDKKICPGVVLSTVNPIWTSLGANLGHRDKKPAINHLSYATVQLTV